MGTPERKKVYVGMSGGVDSSVAAALLLREGYEVVGAFMKNWSDTKDPATGNCAWRKEREDAQAVADKLGIPLVTFDFEQDYRLEVVDYMVREYESGRTPNPDVMCNRRIKFGLFMQEALAQGADYVATGHYARIARAGSGKREAGCIDASKKAAYSLQLPASSYVLMAGVDSNKDQSYFLHTMTQEQLSRTLFPVGHIKKAEVRALAREFGLPVADKKDSQGICFIGHVNLGEFLERAIVPKKGPIVTTDGCVVGVHRGIAPYTIGQRHGLGIGDAMPHFVVEKDRARNTLVVARGENPDELYSSELTAKDMHWIAVEPAASMKCKARIRYRQPLEDCAVSIGDSCVQVKFDRPQRAIAPGQFVVFYDGDSCLGGGVII
ncbi:MAG: tRNA 2-thiouridine(34) synthase MnmA [Patescibacteria group bacterium]|nr:tRNA 2-thiouridine(34) synthase MnmA [Patescibacteria group bacterium]